MNAKTTIEKPAGKSHALGARRMAAVADILKQIDDLLLDSRLTTEQAAAAPTTFEFINSLDGPATGPLGAYGVRAKKFPAAIFSRFDPEAPAQNPMIKPDYGTIIPFRPETLAAIIEAATPFVENAAILDEDDLATLRKIQTKFTSVGQELQKYSNTAANTEFQQQKNRRVAEALETGALPDKSVRTFESIYTEFNANRAALTEVQLQLSHQAYPLVLKAYRRVFELVRGQMARLEATERELAAAFRIPWAPSYLWKSCAAIQIRLHPSRIADAASQANNPQVLLEGILKL